MTIIFLRPLTLLFLLSCSISGYAANTQIIIETNRGNLDVELFDQEAPETVKNFLAYAQEGFYNGTIFHRVIEGFVIQGGGFTKELAKKKAKKPIKNEAKKELKNVRGTLAMARLSAPNSATSQFFINLVDNSNLDYRPWNIGYAVFGKVSEMSMTIADEISVTPTGTIGMYRDVPTDAIEILNIQILQPAPAASEEGAEVAANETENAESNEGATQPSSP